MPYCCRHFFSLFQFVTLHVADRSNQVGSSHPRICHSVHNSISAVTRTSRKLVSCLFSTAYILPWFQIENSLLFIWLLSCYIADCLINDQLAIVVELCIRKWKFPRKKKKNGATSDNKGNCKGVLWLPHKLWGIDFVALSRIICCPQAGSGWSVMIARQPDARNWQQRDFVAPEDNRDTVQLIKPNPQCASFLLPRKNLHGGS